MTAPTDPVERAARIIARHIDGNVLGWGEYSLRWKNRYRAVARAVLDDLAANTPTPEEAA